MRFILTIPLVYAALKDPAKLAVESEIQDQPTLDKFLGIKGELQQGQFGTDVDHVPRVEMWNLKEETIPVSVIDPLAAGDAKIVLDQLLYRAGPTAVYTITGHPDLVIKYYAYCVDKYEPHDAIVVEAYFMKRLERLSIAPKFYFYSGYIDTVPGGLAESKLIESTCGVDALKPHIRYMIMERLGLSWQSYMERSRGGRIGFVRAIKIGAKVIMLLHKLHDENIVHGDGHMGNFVFRGQEQFKELAIIDFGRARIVGGDEQRTYQSSPGSFCSQRSTLYPWLGKWEMNGCKPSFHDDVYRAVQCAAMSMHGMRHFDFLEGLIKTNREEYIRRKNEADFWELPGMTLKRRLRRRDRLGTVRGLLGEVSKLASTMDPSDPHKKPPYDDILAKYRQIIHEVTGAPIDADTIFEL